MKAYCVSCEPWDFATVVFAETRGKAIALAMHTDACEDAEFTEIRAYRRPALDKHYRGLPEMDWDNAEDRIALVRDGGFSCSYEIDNCYLECEECPAAEWCGRYESMTEVDDDA